MARLKPQLKKLIDSALDKHGLPLRIAQEQIRIYTQRQQLDTLEEEIAFLLNEREVNLLLGSGMRGLVWDMVNRRRLSLMGMRPVSLRKLSDATKREVEESI